MLAKNSLGQNFAVVEEREKGFATDECNSFEKLTKLQNNKKIVNYSQGKEPFERVIGGPIHWQ